MVTRRELLRSTAFVPVGIALAGCTLLQAIEQQPVPQAFITAAGYLSSFAQAVLGELPVIAKSLGLSITSGPLVQLLAYAQQLATVAGTIATTAVPATAQSALTTAEGIIDAIVAGLSALNLTGTAGEIVSAISNVLPVIQALINNTVGTARARTVDFANAIVVLDRAAVGTP